MIVIDPLTVQSNVTLVETELCEAVTVGSNELPSLVIPEMTPVLELMDRPPAGRSRSG